MSLSLKDQLVTLYLTPLLEKHGRKQPITYENLQQAKQAADAFIQQAQQQQNNSSDQHKQADNEPAMEELSKLHKSQVMLYREQAAHALMEWGQTWTLPDPTAGESQEQYAQRCRSLAFEERPFWKLGTGMLHKILNPIIDERAPAKYMASKQNQAKPTNDDTTVMVTTTNTNDEESEGEVDEGEDHENNVEDMDDVDGAHANEDDDDDDEGEVDESPASTTEQPSTTSQGNKPTGNKKVLLNKKRGGIPIKKTIQRKKRPAVAAAAAADKANQPKRAGANKKRGRGGSAAAASSTSNAK